MMAVIFIVMPCMHLINYKDVLADAKNIEYLWLLCVYSFYSVFIQVDLCQSASYFSDIPLHQVNGIT